MHERSASDSWVYFTLAIPAELHKLVHIIALLNWPHLCMSKACAFDVCVPCFHVLASGDGLQCCFSVMRDLISAVICMLRGCGSHSIGLLSGNKHALQLHPNDVLW